MERRLMLLLMRRPGEAIMIGDSIVMTVVKCEHGRVHIGVAAPPDVKVLREEIYAGAATTSEPAIGAQARTSFQRSHKRSSRESPRTGK